MTDNELLTMTANAAGLDVVGSHDDGLCLQRPLRLVWNPLMDDADALRLAVRCGLVVCVMLDMGFSGIYLPAEHIGGKYDIVERHGEDAELATRRAIVKAVALKEQSK